MKYELIIYSVGNKTQKFFARSVEQAEQAIQEGKFLQMNTTERIYLVERSTGLVVKEW
jgi:anthranilate/para-aminobenzoate synthase component I